MRACQKTVGAVVKFDGVGLHTGAACSVQVGPAADNSGLRLLRADLEGQPVIPADASFVRETSRGTTLACDAASVQTVEHLLSALAGMEIDNAALEVYGPEIPALDGSALPFAEGMSRAGTREQAATRNALVVEEPFEFEHDKTGARYSVAPSDTFRASVAFHFDHSLTGVQWCELSSLDGYGEKIAPARTFCYLSELEALLKAGLARGGSLENAFVLVDEEWSQDREATLRSRFHIPESIRPDEDGILSLPQKGHRSLRFSDEPARHKLLDLIGDLALFGRPLLARVDASRPSHTANVAFVRHLQRRYTRA